MSDAYSIYNPSYNTGDFPHPYHGLFPPQPPPVVRHCVCTRHRCQCCGGCPCDCTCRPSWVVTGTSTINIHYTPPEPRPLRPEDV